MKELFNKEKPLGPEEIKYLKEGKQTRITPKILEIVNSDEFEKENFEDKIKAIFSFIKKLKYNKEEKDKIFRKRSADEIISSGFVTGCTDEALVFITLARAMKIPAKYIETIDLKFLDKKEESEYGGHVYSGVFKEGDGWMVVDSTKSKLNANPGEDGRVVFREGLDSWDIGIFDYETLRREFEKFKSTFKY